jgi:hypothetical protein
MLNNTQPATRCNGANCVEVVVTAAGYDFISTLGTDKGKVSYTPAEVVAFLSDVKAGKHDALLHQAVERAIVQARTEAELATL